MIDINTRLAVAIRAYKEAWDQSRAMANAPAIPVGEPRRIGPFVVRDTVPAYTRERIAAEAARCRRMYRVMSNYRAKKMAK